MGEFYCAEICYCWDWWSFRCYLPLWYLLIPVKYSFPVLTLVINFLGSTLIGFIIGLSLAANLSANTLLFWKTGVCGGFTTFSAFSAEAWQLFQTGKIWQGGLYVVLSVGLCLAGVAMGQSFR